MSDFISILTHERRLRANTKDLTVEDLKDVQEKLTRIISVREEEELEMRRVEDEKRERVEAIRKQMQESGVDIGDLVPELNTASGNKKSTASLRKRTPKAAKYEYHVDGERKTWTGQGRTPKVIQQALDNGKSLQSFLIK